MSDNKKWYKLIFKQIQPIHIGFGSYGVVNETRIFIPGWTMWGALTKAYNLKKANELSQNQKLFENISCFYPCFDKNGENILFPEFKGGRFYLDNYSEDEFRAKFVDNVISTAINPATNTALEESLHEINVILPGVKSEYLEKDYERQLYWVGIIAITEEIKNNLAKEIYIGGEARYGLGKMILVKSEDFFQELPSDWKEKDGVLRNYLAIEQGNNKTVKGKIELLVEITNSWEGAELSVEKKDFCFIPGTQLLINIQNFTLKKGMLI